jgi:hypothetical protein
MLAEGGKTHGLVPGVVQLDAGGSVVLEREEKDFSDMVYQPN